ncbi:hypothetical protein [Streptacidiphilus sp. EB129]|uniref:hypothetical protein n=1 Tax=Streptacidiphilus sp. EB129 TaxID=3156262 RepID=UPI0035135798
MFDLYPLAWAGGLPEEAGVFWDVVAIPAGRGPRLFDRLGADHPHRIGPVIHSARSWQTHCLITLGTVAEAWPDSCRFLSLGSFVTLPALGLDQTVAAGCICPKTPPSLTGAVLARRPLDACRWTNGTCNVCTHPTPVADAIDGVLCRGCLQYRLFLDRDCGMALRSLAQPAGEPR